jgi:ribose 5-phosphate isomerase B
MKVYIGSDHAGYGLKERLKEYLSGLGLEVVDKGADKFDSNDDYPDFIKLVAAAVADDTQSKGIILGGSGQGEAICANKIKGIRAVVFYGPQEPISEVEINGRKSADTFEIIKLVREHNNANILSLGARFMTEDEAKFAAELFLNTKFPGEERHIRRINKIE